MHAMQKKSEREREKERIEEEKTHEAPSDTGVAALCQIFAFENHELRIPVFCTVPAFMQTSTLREILK